ncbi:carbohydrate kinase family protein [Halalkalibacter krulwichiae]|uniref:5-dehydro-2-deoxygluconokinase n=1 Tax=Halalkalibacter krulwichiae TaxID=199441 RepID=A0A1X9ME67_9BACI|nr:carbohydrate kinase [Halalkalibacter krulwichiae]ARK29831.1 5-dehydro-2-deoxygluconokinase [Halalkalibacter krulwichiae]
MYDIVSLGELLIDLIPHDDFTQEQFAYEAKVGGAPVNVLSGLAKWGHSSAYIAKVGNDAFGRYLKEKIERADIDANHIKVDSKAPTTVAVVTLDERGERTFDFIRNPGADQLLTKDEIDYSLIRRTKIFHFGTLSLTHHPSREATLEVIKYAKEQSKLISFDPNYRPLLWEDQDDAKRMILEGLQWADLVKISDEEVEFLTNDKEVVSAAEQLARKYQIPMLFVTKGKEGAAVICNGHLLFEKGRTVQPVDTTGAGDAFMASVLHQFLVKDKPISAITKEDLADMLQFANDAASMSTMKKGGFGVVPAIDELQINNRTEV